MDLGCSDPPVFMCYSELVYIIFLHTATEAKSQRSELRCRSMLSTSSTTTRAFNIKCSAFLSPCNARSHMGSPPRNLRCALKEPSSSHFPNTGAASAQESMGGSFISLQEWQAWGTASPVPTLVSSVIGDLKALEKETHTQMSFGGLGGKLQGEFKIQEEKIHRARYQALDDPDEKLKFFAARQIACRLLGSRGYLCQKCWLTQIDCMCGKLKPSPLWKGIRFWLYMHPKDFLRQNNTGKLLWQVFGVQAATLCLYGIIEHEKILWDALTIAGKNKVWCLYPNRNACTKSVQESLGEQSLLDFNSPASKTAGDETLNFILIDGTWNNSAAMFKRLQEHASIVWGEDLPCITLSAGASPMHKLRPQPSWDRTCTAAASVGLLSELHSVPEFSGYELDKQAEAVEDALTSLLEALTARRVHTGRSITRSRRHSNDIC